MLKTLYEKNKDLNIRITEPNWSDKDQNFKKVQFWTKKEKYEGQTVDPGKQYIIIPGNGIIELDHDYSKYVTSSQSLKLLSFYKNLYSLAVVHLVGCQRAPHK